MAKFTPKQQAFINEYLCDLNATQAAIRAGYSKKRAGEIGYQLLQKTTIQKAINEVMNKKEDETIAKQDEVLRYLTSVMRGDIDEECVVTENVGDFQSRATVVKKQVTPKDRNKAAELLAKRYGLLTDKLEHSGEVVTIVDNIPRVDED